MKLFLRIIDRRIYNKLEDHTGYKQIGFKQGLFTKKALFAVQVFMKR